MKRRFSLILLTLCFLGRGCAEGADAPSQIVPPQPSTVKPITIVKTQMAETPLPPTQPQKVDFGSCFKFFKMDDQKLFYLTLASVNANQFKINEIQSKSGYVLFSVKQMQFLASIINIDSKNSMLKITPCNNVYFFPPGIVQNMFKYIELNINTPVEKLAIY